MTYRKHMRLACFVALAPLAACGPDDGTGACKDNLLPGDLVITEVFADYAAPAGGAGTDDGKEWFEVFNNTDRPVSLKGLTIVHSRPDGSRSKQHNMAEVTIAPGQYFTLGNATQDLVPPYVDYGYGNGLGDLFNTDGGKLALSCGSSEIDSALYNSVRAGRSRQLTSASPPDYTLNDDPNNWCEARSSEFEPNNFGTPGQENDCMPIVAGACNDNGVMREVVSPGVGEVVITEVMPNPAAVPDADGEWFEVYALEDIDLNGVSIDRAGDSSAPTLVESPTCLKVSAGTYALFAKKTDMAINGGLPAAQIMGTFSFALIDGSSTTPGDVQILLGTTLLDSITWTSTRVGRSHQLAPERFDPIANDEASNFCDATTIYNDNNGGTPKDYGTPGTANLACPLVVPAGMCDAGGTLRPIVKPAANQLVITELMPRPLVGDNGAGEWFEVTNVGTTSFDLNGLGLDRDTDSRAPDIITAAACKPVAPGAFALLARGTNPDTNGGLPTVDATFGFGMVNTNGNVRVVDPATCDAASPFACTMVYDSVSYTTTAQWPFFATAGVSGQLRPNMYTTTANDDPASYCAGTADYGAGGKGTPRAGNVCP
jgi:hypothetical protein